MCACVYTCSTRYVHDNNNICKIFPSRRNESVLRRDRNDMRSSAARHITRTRFRGTCFPRPMDGRRHCKQFFSTDRRRGRRDDDKDGRTRIYTAHHRGTPCVAAASSVH